MYGQALILIQRGAWGPWKVVLRIILYDNMNCSLSTEDAVVMQSAVSHLSSCVCSFLKVPASTDGCTDMTLSLEELGLGRRNLGSRRSKFLDSPMGFGSR